MNLTGIATLACVGATLGGVAAAVRFTLPGATRVPIAVAPAIAAVSSSPLARGPSPDSLAAVTIARHPFRFDRTPPPAAFDPNLAGDAPPPQRPPRPTLTLVGIALGTERAALIDGLPGNEGTRVLRVGEAFAGYAVRNIAEDHVVLQGPDTTWTLRVRGTRP